MLFCSFRQIIRGTARSFKLRAVFFVLIYFKVGCYIFFLLLVIFIHRPLYVVAFFAITYLLTGADELLQKTSAIGTGISLVTVFYPQLLWICEMKK